MVRVGPAPEKRVLAYGCIFCPAPCKLKTTLKRLPIILASRFGRKRSIPLPYSCRAKGTRLRTRCIYGRPKHAVCFDNRTCHRKWSTGILFGLIDENPALFRHGDVLLARRRSLRKTWRTLVIGCELSEAFKRWTEAGLV